MWSKEASVSNLGRALLTMGRALITAIQVHMYSNL